MGRLVFNEPRHGFLVLARHGRIPPELSEQPALAAHLASEPLAERADRVRLRHLHRVIRLIKVGEWLEAHGTALLGMCDSGHPGPKGNVEYFAYFCDGRSPLAQARIEASVAATLAVESVHA